MFCSCLLPSFLDAMSDDQLVNVCHIVTVTFGASLSQCWSLVPQASCRVFVLLFVCGTKLHGIIASRGTTLHHAVELNSRG